MVRNDKGMENRVKQFPVYVSFQNCKAAQFPMKLSISILIFPYPVRMGHGPLRNHMRARDYSFEIVEDNIHKQGDGILRSLIRII